MLIPFERQPVFTDSVYTPNIRSVFLLKECCLRVELCKRTLKHLMFSGFCSISQKITLRTLACRKNTNEYLTSELHSISLANFMYNLSSDVFFPFMG